MIDKVYVINLDRRKDKWLAQQCAFLLMEVPPSRVERFPAIDGRSYSDLQLISEAMQADGFYCYTYPPSWESWGDPPRLACHWSHLKVLRKVVENDETAVVLEDDVLLSVNFRELENKLRQLKDSVQIPLEILFLEWWFPSPTTNPDFSDIPCHEYSERQELRMRQTSVERIYKDFLGAGDRARIITARGAATIVRKMHNAYPWGIGEMLPWNIGLHQMGLHTQTGRDFAFREQFWAACHQLSPFGFYAMKPEGIKHARKLFEKRSDVWEDKNQRP